VALRPEKIEVARRRAPGPGAPGTTPDAAESEAGGAVSGIVKEIGYMGGLSTYLIEIGSGRVVRVTLPNSARDAEQSISRGDAVSLTWHRSSPIVLSR
ncbi:MAG: TOBE domain-containing protein, partial [Steroidobacteraceae bacterium]